MDRRRVLVVVAIGGAVALGWYLFGPKGAEGGDPGEPVAMPAPGMETAPEGEATESEPALAGWTDRLAVSHEGNLEELLDWLQKQVAFSIVVDREDPVLAERLAKPLSLSGVMSPGNILTGIAEMARFDLVVTHDGEGAVTAVSILPGSGKVTFETP